MNRPFHLVTIATLLLLSTLSVIITSPASYASDPATTGIGIAPLTQEGTIQPGFVYSGTLLVKNNGTNTQIIDLSAESFNVTDPAYNYAFTAGTPEASWVSFDKSTLSLAPQANDSVHYQVNVPNDAQPGGYYLALFAVNRASQNTSAGITPTERVGSLLYLTVSGQATRIGHLIQLSSPLVVFGNDTWSATLQNSGTLHYRSTYSVSIRNILNHQVSYQEDSRLILPNSVRLVEANLTSPAIIGLYKAVYTISLGDTPGVQETRWFLYLPPLQGGIVLLIVGGIMTVLISRQRKRKSKSKT